MLCPQGSAEGAQTLWQDSGEGWEITDYVPLTDGTVFLSLRRECKAQSPLHTATELGYRNDLDHGFTRRYVYRLLCLHGNQAEVFSEGDIPFRHLTAWGDRLLLAGRRWMLIGPEAHAMEEVDPDLIPGNLAPAAMYDTLLLPGRDREGRTVLHLCKPGSDEPPLPVRDLPDQVGIGSVYADLGPGPASQTAADDTGFIFIGLTGGKPGLYRIDPKAEHPCARLCVKTPLSIFEVACGKETYVLAGGSGTYPDICRIADGEVRPLSLHGTYNLKLREHTQLHPYLPLTVPAPDGKTELHGFLCLPENPSGRPIPLLVWVHGGPEGCFVPLPYLEIQAAVDRGYAVLLPNPRGSSGFGEAYQASDHAFDGGAASDILTLLDHALRTRGDLDPTHLGVIGGSYGGFMAVHMAGATDRFKAAVAMKPVTNWLTIHFKSSQSGQDVFAQHFDLRDFLLDTFLTSPVSSFPQIRTPLLLLHGLEDQQCPPENSSQLYTLLKAAHPDLPVSLKLYPGTCHRYASGSVDTYIDIQLSALNWLDTYIKGGCDP
ncbi:MAG: S9 family peptidase [Clostridia bacterium]|nr:S9 family peptidase [Clostridia bacterium]